MLKLTEPNRKATTATVGAAEITTLVTIASQKAPTTMVDDARFS